MKRGSIVIAAERGDLTTKPRPWLVVQRQSLIEHSPVLTACLITTTPAGAGPFRIALAPSRLNGLNQDSEVEVDRVVTFRKHRVRRVIGELGAEQMIQVDRALRLWLDL